MLPYILAMIAIALLINSMLAVIVVFFERRNPASTWAWIIVLILLPFLGFIVYLVFGQEAKKHRHFIKKNNEDISTRSAFVRTYEGGLYSKMVTKQMDQIKKHENILGSDAKPSFLDMVYHNLNCDGSALTDDNDVVIFHDGQEKFNRLIDDIRDAKDAIHIEYYIIRGDDLGRSIIRELAEKAGQGICVRLLYDGMGCIRLPRNFFKPLTDAGGLVASFLPPLIPLFNIRINYRNHRKLCVIDGRVGYIGGFNIGNEYLGLLPKYGNWRDCHIRLTGSAVSQLQLRFIMDWNYADSRKLTMEDRSFNNIPSSTQQVKMQIVSSGPDTFDANIKNAYFKMMNEAEQKVYFTTPYFVPDDSILSALKVAALSGIDVRVVFPANPDHPFVYWASISYLGELLDAGVRCYQYKKGFIHSKMIVIDSLIASVGTANMDIRSFKLNFEINAFIYNKQIAANLEKQFLKDVGDSEEITREAYSQRPSGFRVKEAFSRLISPIL